MKHWSKHFLYYDKFQIAFSGYLAMLKFFSKSVKDFKFILDSGAGTGNITIKLLEDGHKVVAIDNNEIAIKILKKKIRSLSHNLEIIKTDLSKKLPFPNNYFDGVVSSLVICYLPNPKFYLKEIYRVLKTNGILSLSVPLPIKGQVDILLTNLEVELKERGLLPKYLDVYEKYKETTYKNEKLILNNNLTKNRLLDYVKCAGFKSITYPAIQPYGKFILLISCKKGDTK